MLDCLWLSVVAVREKAGLKYNQIKISCMAEISEALGLCTITSKFYIITNLKLSSNSFTPMMFNKMIDNFSCRTMPVPPCYILLFYIQILHQNGPCVLFCSPESILETNRNLLKNKEDHWHCSRRESLCQEMVRFQKNVFYLNIVI